MAYYIDLFSPETHLAFSKSQQNVSGFRTRQAKTAARILPGDKLVCYMTKLGRWIGVLEVISPSFEDHTPIFLPDEDPFCVRFRVKPLVWFEDANKCVPIRDDRIWNNLSFTKDCDKKSSAWTGRVRGSLARLSDEDGRFLEQYLMRQNGIHEIFEYNQEEYLKPSYHPVTKSGKTIGVSIPSDDEEEVNGPSVRESIKIQAMLADIGSKMGMRIWIPRGDRNKVINEISDSRQLISGNLPLNYDETTLKTIEQIDVLWLKGRSITRAFEVEHTTSIYSGILRMADLLALQPNMDIRLHIVAPASRREKVFSEIKRPIFSLLERRPLYECCTYLSYDSVLELSKEKHLSYLSDEVLDDYAEEVE